MNRIRSKFKLPDELVGKTIGIIGTYPGVGKSHIKNDWAAKLKLQGFKVKNLGTTQKASIDRTVSALYEYKFKKDENRERESDERILKEHENTHAFIFVDEAWFYNQKQINEVKEKYPHCCFVLFGDPLQFNPVKGGATITKLDYCINLNKPFRFLNKQQYTDTILFDAIKEIKSGRIPIDFMMQHTVENPDPKKEICITYKTATRDRFNASLKGFHQKVIVKSMKITYYTDENNQKHRVTNRKAVWRNMDLWEISKIEEGISAELKNISGGHIIKVTWEELNLYFEIQQTVNIHKVQGETITEKNILIYLDNFLFKKDRIQDFLQYLYVAISRAKDHTQIKFLKSHVEELNYTPTQGKELSHSLKIDKECDSSDLATITDVSNFLCQCCGCIYTNIDKNVQVLNSLSLGLVQTKEVNDTRILKPKIWTNKKAQQRYQCSSTGQGYNCKSFIYDNNSNWIIKNPMKKINNAHSHRHDDLDWDHVHWFCFEFDLEDNTDIEKSQFIPVQKELIKFLKPYLHHTVFSGNEGYHLWFYVENNPKNIDEYHYLVDCFKKLISEIKLRGKYTLKPCSSGKSPSQPMRKPNAIRTLKDGTEVEQTYYDYGMKNVLIANYEVKPTVIELPQSQQQPQKMQSCSNKVIFAFNLFKNDHDGKNGGRGSLIFSKCRKQIQEFGFTYAEACYLSDLLCDAWKCPEKKNRLHNDLKKIA